jgi:DNA-3-methyladenine glycosylase II
MSKELEYSIRGKEILTLCKNDPKLEKVINLIGDITVTMKTDYYESLVKSIIGQQLSILAATTIWSRVKKISVDISPSNINRISDEKFREAGVSKQKISYIRDLNNKILNNELDLDSLAHLSDLEVINTLTKVKGIGKWTAEMFLIFSLGRENILSFGDAGIKRAIKWTYSQEADDLLNELYERWAPYNSIASLYMWELINSGLINRFKNLNDVIIFK